MTVDAAITLAPQGSGPLLDAARYTYFVPRLDAAETYLDTIEQRAAVKPTDKLAVCVGPF